jgi:hypothetical protein
MSKKLYLFMSLFYLAIWIFAVIFLYTISWKIFVGVTLLVMANNGSVDLMFKGKVEKIIVEFTKDIFTGLGR